MDWYFLDDYRGESPTKYEISYRKGSAVEYTKVWSTSSSYTVTNVESNTEYEVFVTPYNNNVKGSTNSNTATVSTGERTHTY